MLKILNFICNFFLLISLFFLCDSSLMAITEIAVHTAENLKQELAVLLKQDTAKMTPTEYAAWKKKVEDGLAYIQKIYPASLPSYQNAIKLREETYNIAHPTSVQIQSADLKSVKSTPTESTITTLPSALEQEGLVAFNKAVEKIALFPEQIKKELQKLDLKPGSLPQLYLKWQELDAVDDLYTELLLTKSITSDIKKKFENQRALVLKSISNGAADITNAVLNFVLTNSNGLKAQLLISAELVQFDTLEELGKASWPDINHAISLFLAMNDLLQEGCWQDNDILITLLPSADQDKINSIKTNVNALINHTQKNGLPVGIYDQLVHTMKQFLQNFDHSIDNQSIDQAIRTTLAQHCELLTDYVACMLECETVLLKHFNQKGIEIGSIDQYGAQELIIVLNTIKQKISAHDASLTNKKKSEIDDLLITFDAASLAIHKVTEAFINPVIDSIPNIDPLYVQVEKTYNTYLDLVHAQKISTEEQDIFLNAYNNVLKDLDTQTIAFANKILSYIENKDNLLAINTWLKTLVSSYAKGTKKINTLSVDNETQFKMYTKLIEVLSLLFAKGVALEGHQSVNLKIIVKRGVVEQHVMTEFENHINTLFNTAKDTNGVIKGLVSRAIESIDSLLLLAQEYMATVDVLIVKAYQLQIAPLVQLLEQLFAMENELVVPELQKFVKQHIQNPFSSTSIIEDAHMLIDPAHASELALHVSTASKAASTPAVLQDTSSSFMHNILAVLDSVQDDITKKLSSTNVPNNIPSFADQYMHAVDAEVLYHDAKQEFSAQDKELYKAKSNQIMQNIDFAVIQVALKAATFICQSGGLFETQLAYINTISSQFKNGQKNVLDVAQSKDFQKALKDGQLLQKICQKAFIPLKKISVQIVTLNSIRNDSDTLKNLLNKMLDSSPDIKLEHTPTGLCDKLIDAWLAFFNTWKESIKNSTVDQIQQMQRQLKPTLDLLSCYRTVISSLQEAAVVMPIMHKDISITFMDTIENMLNIRKAELLIEPSVARSSMQSKQTVSSDKALTVPASTVPVKTSDKTAMQKTTNTSSSTTTSAKKGSPDTIALDSFATLQTDFSTAVSKIDMVKGIVPDIQQFFDAVEKTKDSFEFDSALQPVTADNTAKVETAYQGLLLFGLQKSFFVGKVALEYENTFIGTLVKDLLALLKTYETDTKKIADIKKDQMLKGLCDRIKTIDELCNKSIFKLVGIKNIKIKGAIDSLDPFLKQLNILVDSTKKNNIRVGLLNQLLEAWQLLFDTCLTYMKTLSVEEVGAYQKELLVLQDTCVLLDKFVTKLLSITDPERVKIKNGVISSSFNTTLQEITKKDNAMRYAKVEHDIQRALVSVSEVGSKKK